MKSYGFDPSRLAAWIGERAALNLKSDRPSEAQAFVDKELAELRAALAAGAFNGVD